MKFFPGINGLKLFRQRGKPKPPSGFIHTTDRTISPGATESTSAKSTEFERLILPEPRAPIHRCM